MKNRNDPAELRQYSGKHLMHEISMLWQTTDALPLHAKGTVEHVALLESFVTHLRNLIEFLFFEISRDDVVRARHFVDDRALWKYSTKSPCWETYWEHQYNRACHEVNHLLIGRIDDDDAESRTWEVGKLRMQIEPILREFASGASTDRLDKKVREFFQQPSDKVPGWLGYNVPLTNIAMTVNVSTSTPIPPVVLRKPNP